MSRHLCRHDYALTVQEKDLGDRPPDWQTIITRDKATFAYLPVSTLSERVTQRTLGFSNFDDVYFSEQRQKLGNFPLHIQKNHYIGNIETFDAEAALVNYTSVNGKPKTGQSTIKGNHLFPSVESYQNYAPGQAVWYSSNRGLELHEYAGQIRRIFKNGIAEVNWDLVNGEKAQKDLDYVPVFRLNTGLAGPTSFFNATPLDGVTLADDGYPYLAAFSQERGLKKAPLEYLLELDRVVLERGNALCQKKGFKGLVAEPLTRPYNPTEFSEHPLTLTTGENFEPSTTPLYHPWRFINNGSLGRGIAVGVGIGIPIIAAGVLGPFLLGPGAIAIAVDGFMVGSLAGMGAGSAAKFLVRKEISSEHALERNKNRKILHKRYEKSKDKVKVPHLIFSKVVCGDTPETLIRFEEDAPVDPIASTDPVAPTAVYKRNNASFP
ncbi:MAG: hypothetical protein ABI041_11840 [Bdellovibrionia bacterium]